MKRRLLPPCTALVLCLLLAPAAWAAVYPYPPIETLHIGSHDGTEIQKDTYYLVRGHSGCQRRQLQYLLQGRDAHPARGGAAGLPPCAWRDHHPLGGRKHHWHERLPHRRGHPRRHPRGHHHHWPRLLLHSQQRRRHHHGTTRQRHRPPSNK